MLRPLAAVAAIAWIASGLRLACAQDAAAAAAPHEFGRVRFGRSFDAALAEAKRASKPVFVLFQEVPG